MLRCDIVLCKSANNLQLTLYYQKISFSIQLKYACVHTLCVCFMCVCLCVCASNACKNLIQLLSI